MHDGRKGEATGGGKTAVQGEAKSYKAFLLTTWFTIAVFVIGVFTGLALRTRDLIHDEILAQARAHFRSIVLTRQWNADYGGVYVEKREGVLSNPFLKDPDITAVGGKVYTRKNPALMTREISEYAEREGLYEFHITSLNLLNPDNAPDRFERMALEGFDGGLKEVFIREEREGGEHFRYMAPLYVEKSCLECHAEQGYRVGDVRGGISVTFSIEGIQNELKRNFIVIAVLAVLSALLLIVLIYFYTSKLRKKLTEARREIERLAAEDTLTGISNRRHTMLHFEKEVNRSKRFKKPLACMIIDVDNFKDINDTYGHLVGDRVLKAIADLISGSMRAFNIFGRYGGDEFLLILQETTVDGAETMAERIREDVKSTYALDVQEVLAVSVSIGITELVQTDETANDLIKRADEGLYKAKNAGRDCIRRA